MAMRTKIRAHWARVRFFVTLLVALSILATLVYLLTGGGLLRAKASLYSYFEDSGGMGQDALVLYNGVKIGKVTSVKLSHINDPQRVVVVRMSIERRFLSQIPRYSKSEIVTENFLGDKYIQINRGQSPEPAADDMELGHKPATNVYIRIDLTTFAAMLRDIDATLKDIQDGKSDLGQFVMTDRLYQDFLSGVKRVENDIETLADTKSTLGSLLYGKAMHDDLSATFKRLDASLAEIQAGRGASGKLMRDPAAYDDLRKSLEDVRGQIASIRDTNFMKSDELYNSLNRSLADASRGVDAFNASEMMTSQQVYESALGGVQELGNSLHDFRTNPRKYLRLKIF
jgi:phospholipid/cholesterol/gamma-HCH transport system substrate-binding protein